MKHLIVIFAIKLQRILRFLKLSGGTALPGFIVERYYPNYTNYLLSKIPNIILITGTNGKTTTAKALDEILSTKHSTIRNSGGANLIRGISSTLIESRDKISDGKITYAILEIEEASLPQLTKRCSPKVLILTNIFRDQLDAYGEIDTTAEYLRLGASAMPEGSTIIYNIDDARLNYLLENITSVNKISFSLEKKPKETGINNSKYRQANDLKKCPRCRENIDFEFIIYSHLGRYHCSNCGFSNAKSDYKVFERVEKDEKTCFSINDQTYCTGLSGTYNVYNLASAIVSALELGVESRTITKVIDNFKAAFGRQEVFNLLGRKVSMILVKNPSGFDNTLKILIKKQAKHIIFALNDNIADGRDVSWIWDVNFEILDQVNFDTIIVTGSRATDMALRLKYAGVDMSKVNITEEISEAISTLKEYDSSDEIYILPTYTAMLELRKELQKTTTQNKEFWK